MRICAPPSETKYRLPITGIHLQGADVLMWQQGKDIKELSYLEQNAKAMLDELHWWASALMVARELPNEDSHRRSAV
jgi:hypothetical protein